MFLLYDYTTRQRRAKKMATGGNAHVYSLGDKYSSNFDYDGMLDYAENVTAETPLDDLNKLYESAEDVNYSNIASPVWDLIKAKESGDIDAQRNAIASLSVAVAKRKEEANLEPHPPEVLEDVVLLYKSFHEAEPEEKCSVVAKRLDDHGISKEVQHAIKRQAQQDKADGLNLDDSQIKTTLVLNMDNPNWVSGESFEEGGEADGLYGFGGVVLALAAGTAGGYFLRGVKQRKDLPYHVKVLVNEKTKKATFYVDENDGAKGKPPKWKKISESNVLAIDPKESQNEFYEENFYQRSRKGDVTTIHYYKKSFEKGGEADNPHKHTYMMLSRLQSDNDYFLGAGGGNENRLWAGNVDAQIKEMKRLWNDLPEDGKPEWLSMEDIEDYAAKMQDHDGEPNYEGGGEILAGTMSTADAQAIVAGLSDEQVMEEINHYLYYEIQDDPQGLENIELAREALIETYSNEYGFGGIVAATAVGAMGGAALAKYLRYKGMPQQVRVFTPNDPKQIRLTQFLDPEDGEWTAVGHLPKAEVVKREVVVFQTSRLYQKEPSKSKKGKSTMSNARGVWTYYKLKPFKMFKEGGEANTELHEVLKGHGYTKKGEYFYKDNIVADVRDEYTHFGLKSRVDEHGKNGFARRVENEKVDDYITKFFKKGGRPTAGRKIIFEDDNIIVEYNEVSDWYSIRDAKTGKFMKAGGEAKFCDVGTRVQTLIFNKDEFSTKAKAKKWAKEHDFKYGKVDEKENSFRIRQEEPAQFKKNTFRTIKFKDGLQAVIACPKNTDHLEEGGEVDLFEDYENIPENVRVILEQYNYGQQEEYADIDKMLAAVQAEGYTFDYGLDAMPYGLQKMQTGGVAGKLDPQAKKKVREIVFVMEGDPDYLIESEVQRAFSKPEQRELAVQYARTWFKRGGEIKNQYKNKKPSAVWNAWTVEQRKHFLHDHFQNNSDSTIRKNSNIRWTNSLPKKIKKAVEHHVKAGQYKMGGDTVIY